MAAEMEKLQGCCRGVEKLTPAKNENRPGLDSLNYRIGTHGSFLTTMKARLSDYELDGSEGEEISSPLQALTNRDADDFSIALMDSWALIADVLTFYQERFANEGYLRTATERRSILELARLIGYAPRPGVAASVDLAFSLVKGYSMEIPAGTRVQSLPAPGELPQSFETSEKAKARAEWNLIKPRMTRPQSITWELACDNQEFFIYFQGTATNLKPNQPLLFVLGDGQGLQVMRLIKTVEPQPKEQRTKVTVQKVIFLEVPGSTNDQTTLVSRSLEDSPAMKGNLLESSMAGRSVLFPANSRLVAPKMSGVTRRNDKTKVTDFINDEKSTKKFKETGPAAGKSEMPNFTSREDRIYRLMEAASGGRQNDQKVQSTVPKEYIPLRIYALRLTASLFGHNAPKFTPTGDGEFLTQVIDNTTEGKGGFYLDNSYDKILPESWIAVRRDRDILIGKAEKATVSISREKYGITGKTTHIELENERHLTWLLELCSFIWDRILTDSNEKQKLIEFLTQNFGLDWAKNADITKSADGKTISGSAKNTTTENGFSLKLNDKKTEATLVIEEMRSVNFGWKEKWGSDNEYLIKVLKKQSGLDWEATKLVKSLDGMTIRESTKNNYFLLTLNEGKTEASLMIVGSKSFKFAAKMENDELKIIPEFEVLRETIVHAQSEDLTSKLAEEPIENDVRGKILELDGYYDGLDAGRCLVVSGEARADIGTMISDAEKVTISEVLHGLLTTDRGYPAPQVELINDSSNNDRILSVMSWEGYSKDLFEIAPEFPTCKTGSSASRTCVFIKQFDGKGIQTVYSVTDLGFSGGLDTLKIPMPVLSSNPPFIFLELRDRRRNVSFISNLLPVGTNEYRLEIAPPFIVTTDRNLENRKISYNLAVTNWFDYSGKNYSVKIYYGGRSPDATSNKDLRNLSFDVTLGNNEQEPQFFYISLVVDGTECYSNLASTVPSFFLAGDSPHTTLILEKGLMNTYQRDTVSIYANLVRATHGETRTEILGSGDASQALQEFALRHSPLTYLPAPTPSGASSTLEVRVNDILWHETDSLVGLGPIDRNYVSRMDDKGKTSIIFGNGQQGARLPTGIENIKAKYRSGIGKPGNVRTGQISLLATRPLGLKGVTNPLPATGGADPESNDQARANAPLAVMALDRLVSVQDYEDFARCFAGIGKASAARLSDGRREVVHVSIAGVDDIPIDEDSDLFRNLLLALHRAGDPYQPLVLDLCERLLLMIKAGVRLHPDYLWSSVEANIRAALQKAFSFERRQPGQDVVKSEVISVIQSVPGVEYVDIDLLDSISETEASDLVKTAKKIQKLMDDSNDSITDELEEDPGEKRSGRIVAELARVQNIHEVLESETLDSIALLYGMETSELKLLNPSLKGLEPGTVLSVWTQLLPAQIAYLSSEIPEAVVLKELM